MKFVADLAWSFLRLLLLDLPPFFLRTWLFDESTLTPKMDLLLLEFDL